VADSGVASPLGAGSAITIDGGTLRFTWGHGSDKPFDYHWNLPAGQFRTIATLTLSGKISGTGALTKTGTGTLVLTGTSNTHTDTTISAGILQVGDGTANAGAPGTGTIVNGGELIFDHSNNFSIENTIEGTGKVRKRGTGSTTLGWIFVEHSHGWYDHQRRSIDRREKPLERMR
jgi:autotransporter-associated beta strand protein